MDTLHTMIFIFSGITCGLSLGQAVVTIHRYHERKQEFLVLLDALKTILKQAKYND